VIEAVISQELGLEEYIALIVGRGIDGVLADILGGVDQPTLLASFQQLDAEHPAEVYKYMAETLRRGEAVNERQALRRKLGFQPPTS